MNLANPFYHRLHISQLSAMQLLAPRQAFESAIARFEGYARSWSKTGRAFGTKALFRVVSPRSPRVARRLPWAHHPASRAPIRAHESTRDQADAGKQPSRFAGVKVLEESDPMAARRHTNPSA
jgi:hypothetical protein